MNSHEQIRIGDLTKGRRVLIEINGVQVPAVFKQATTDDHGRFYKFGLGDPETLEFMELKMNAVRKMVKLA